MFFDKRNDTTKLRAEMDALDARRASLMAKSANGERTLDAARAARREYLITGDDDAAAAQKLDRLVRDAESALAALRDALDEIETRRTDVLQRLEIARDQERRAERASELDERADEAEKIAVRLEKDIEKLAGDFDALVAAIPPDALPTRRYQRFIGHDDRALSPLELAGAVLAEGLYLALPPDVFIIVRQHGGGFANIGLPVHCRMADGSLTAAIPFDSPDDVVKFFPASGAADASIIRPLRAAAAKLREGDRPSPAIVEPPLFEIVKVVFTKPVSWVDEWSERKIAEDWIAEVPRPVADAARALGIAVDAGTMEARLHCEKAARLPDANPRAIPHLPQRERVDLGVDLKKLRDAERARLNGSDMRRAAE